jgi:hypothetical protein
MRGARHQRRDEDRRHRVGPVEARVASVREERRRASDEASHQLGDHEGDQQP